MILSKATTLCDDNPYSASSAVIQITACGKILSLNRAAEHLLRSTAGDLVGRPLTTLLDLRSDDFADAVLRTVLDGAADSSACAAIPTTLRRNDGSFLTGLLVVGEPASTGGSRSIKLLPDRDGQNAARKRIEDLEAVLDLQRRHADDWAAERKRLANGIRPLANGVAGLRRAKTEFLANMSHELRTPLTAILGFAEIICDAPGSDETAEFADRIRTNGRHLLHLLDDLFSLARAEAGEAAAVLVPFSPTAVLNAVENEFRPQAAARGLSLESNVGPGIPEWIESDPDKFQQILVKLVSNAVKFTESGGVLIRMLVDPLPRPPQLRVDVVDSGIGIPADRQAEIYEPFMQADSSNSRAYGGSGLGLPLCKHYAELLGGHIEVTSVVDRGSTASLWIALSSAQTLPDQQATPMAAPTLHSDLQGRRILIVEDGPDNLALLSRIVAKAGATIRDAGDGLAGVEIVKAALDHREPIDAILLDMQMPVMDGYTAARQIRQLGYTGPIVAVTADNTDRARVNTIAAGCDACLTKPIHRRELVNLLQQLLLLKQHRCAVLDQELMWE